MDLIVHYSKRHRQYDTIPDLQDRGRSRQRSQESTPWKPHALAHRLTDHDREAIVAAYTRGESAATLAQQFDVARNSIDAILSDAKVPRHLKRMTPQIVEQAVASYRAGNSLAAADDEQARPRHR